MKVLMYLFMVPLGALVVQVNDLSKIRGLYKSAAEVKVDAVQLNKLMLQVDSDAAPLLVCYKGANEMIQAKYTINPIVKFAKFNKGKDLIKKAFSRDTLNLEMRFIRFSIQSNLPTFLGYRDELDNDKRYLLNNTKDSKDTILKEMIFNYLTGLNVIKQEELKQLKN
ncbi:hypothetical protein [Mucilaginibacter sp. UYCu711]|uniref:hypothetical protein n=1 Tax=Mucilaginibacter sp. UYCu711 TaxID=3156339 RepID=UPI003D261B58